MNDHTRPPTTRARRITWAVFSGALLIVAAVVIYLAIWGSGESQGKDAEQAGRVQAQGQVKTLAEQVNEACTKNPTAARQQGLDCAQAKQIIKEGPKGDPGEPGKTGEQGATGPKGDKGDPGRDGLTPPCLLQANRCVGPTGATGAIGPIGPMGPPGKDGKDGVNGKDGAPGPAGADGKDGATGPQGPAGQNGNDGAPGSPGTDGKDGAPGANAYPFDFTFVIPANPPVSTAHTYNCHIENPSTTATCTEVAQP